MQKTQFDPKIKDMLLQHAQLQNQQQIQSYSYIDNSFAGVTSADVFQNVTSGSIVLSP